jgi:serine/threonine protein kinase
MSLPVGQTIKERYTIRRVISAGGFGTTYLAFDRMLGMDVVIKESKTSGDIERDALLAELQLLTTLDHPRLPKVYEGFSYQGEICLAMQYVPGRDVASYVNLSNADRRAEPLDRPTALRWITQTLEALAYLHQQGIVHRDVKPTNLRVHTETGNIFLLDFGLSQDRNRNAIRAYSPRFSPPEQYNAAASTTPASDVYAVGATLYLLLTGREPPFRDDQHNETLRLPSEEIQTIPADLEHIVLRAMRFEPADRYPDAQAMLDALHAAGYVTQGKAAPVLPANPVYDSQTVPTITASSASYPVGTAAPTANTAIMLLPLGSTIRERYHVREVLSTGGGFGTTYRAFDVQLQQEVVIKASKTNDDVQQNALLEERQILAKLQHPRLPKVYDAFFHGRLFCLSLEYIPGRDVSSYLREGPPDQRTALRWISQLLAALAYLHQREIVHCDIKPANLRIHKDSGDLYVLDFGISQRHDRMVVRGYSPPFAAPEQRSRSTIITPAADVYAVGATLYNLLTGAPPPDASTDTSKPLLLPDDPQHPIADSLKQVLLKAMAPRAMDRYPNAAAMLQALRRSGYAQTTRQPVRRVWLGTAFLAFLGVLLTLVLVFRAQPNLANLPAPTAEASVAVPIANIALVEPASQPTLAESSPITAQPASSASTSTAEQDVPTGEPTAEPTPTTRPSATALPSSTPIPYKVESIDVIGQEEGPIFVGRLPLQLTFLGEQLADIRTVTLKPLAADNQRAAIGLSIRRAQSGRLDLELTSLPGDFQNGNYQLLLNGQPTETRLMLRDFLREARILGIKEEYRYLAAIRPFPFYRFKGQEIPGPFGMLYLRPDEAARGGYLRNGDLLEILDATSNSGWYRVRVKENFDPELAGYTGWVLAWIVEDTPPQPPEPGAIQVSWNIQGESRETVIEWLLQRGVARENIIIDVQNRERIPNVFDSFKADQVVSSEPAAGQWIPPNGTVVLGVRAP